MPHLGEAGPPAPGYRRCVRTVADRRSPELASPARPTRALVVRLEADKGRNDGVAVLVGGIGMVGIGVMLAIDVLLARAL